MKVISHSTTEEAWHEWKQVCAADLCSSDTSAQLQRFGAAKFRAYLKKYASSIGRVEQSMPMAASADAWHLFETFSRIANNRQGKRYKDWLFSRIGQGGENPLDVLEGGATLMMRDVVREYLRREHSPSFICSLNSPVVRSRHGDVTLEDLLPDKLDPQQTMAELEWRQLARDRAADYSPRLSSHERIVLWARAHGLPLNDARLQMWTRRSARVLFQSYRDAVVRLGKWIKQQLPGESPSTLLFVSRLILDELAEIIASNIRQEKRAAYFFKKS